jgi:hypothetical protein
MNSFSQFKRIMKNRFLTGMVILVGISTSCNEDIVLFEVDCSECYTQRPAYAPMTIKLTINEENPEVPFTIYLGEYEKDQIRIEDTAQYSIISVDLIPSRYYSVRAEYHVGGKTVYAVDGDEIELVKVSSQCDSVCWTVRGGETDVRLKYQDPDDLPR